MLSPVPSLNPISSQNGKATAAWLAWFDQVRLLSTDIERALLNVLTRVQNSTGSTITKGTVVGFAGVGADGVLSVAPYLADGSTPSLYILGILDETIPDSDSTGLCSVWGQVSGIDTTAFSVGDILYASPTVAGGLTATKPTAPDNVIPMAAVLTVDSVTGSIFVRPTIEQQKYYGEFTRTTNLTAALTNTAYAIALDTTEIAEGVTLAGSPLTRLTVPQSGLYQITVRYQLTSTNSSPKNARVWFRRNGTTDYANSTSIVSVDSNGGFATITASEFFSLQANDYVELMWAVSDTALSLTAAAATAYAPAAASVIVTVTQIQQ
jgi:hypothetical protein